MFCGSHRLHRRHRLHRLHRLSQWRNVPGGFGNWGNVAGGFSNWGNAAGSFGSWGNLAGGLGSFRRRRPRPFRAQRSRGPGAVRILLAGLAVFAFTRLMAFQDRPNLSKAEKTVLGVALAAVGALLLSLRRSTARYRS
jgi:hypothetical protein